MFIIYIAWPAKTSSFTDYTGPSLKETVTVGYIILDLTDSKLLILSMHNPLMLDTTRVPFTAPNSFLTFSWAVGAGKGGRIFYRTASRRAVSRKELPFWAHDFFYLALFKNGTEIPYTYQATPTELHLIANGGAVTFAFADAETLVFEGTGVALAFLPAKPFSNYQVKNPQLVSLLDPQGGGLHLFRAGTGTRLSSQICDSIHGPVKYFADVPRRIDFSHPHGKIAGAFRFSRFEAAWKESLPSVTQAQTAATRSYSAWMAKMPAVLPEHVEAAQLAWVLPHLNTVPMIGCLTRRTIYCSKFWMNAIWSWDNCFHALEVAEADPELAWHQLLLFADHQAPNGQMADSISDLIPSYAYVKPPIFGWTVLRLIDKIGIQNSKAFVKELYEPICRQTEWWYALRDSDHDGMCEYHHGNDSGWDNATMFDQGYPTEGSDLAAHLVLQQEALGQMASMLGKRKEAAVWQKRAQKQLALLLKHNIKNNRFISPLSGHKSADQCLSLLNYIPMELGARLPSKIRQALVTDLAPNGLFLTDYGLATESPQSPKYNPNGYWRGPIWGPSTYLIFDGLAQAGETTLARTIAQRYCNLCIQSPGFWENYDAITGKGLRCPSYSWTAAVFILLAAWLHDHPSQT